MVGYADDGYASPSSGRAFIYLFIGPPASAAQGRSDAAAITAIYLFIYLLATASAVARLHPAATHGSFIYLFGASCMSSSPRRALEALRIIIYLFIYPPEHSALPLQLHTGMAPVIYLFIYEPAQASARARPSCPAPSLAFIYLFAQERRTGQRRWAGH